MKATISSLIIAKLNMTAAEYQNNIANRMKTAKHLDAATKYHIEATKHNADGDNIKANQSNILSKKYLRLASESIIETVFGKALNNYELIYQPF